MGDAWVAPSECPATAKQRLTFTRAIDAARSELRRDSTVDKRCELRNRLRERADVSIDARPIGREPAGRPSLALVPTRHETSACPNRTGAKKLARSLR